MAVPCGEGPGRVVASGPADATASGEAERQDAEVEAARQARYISAFEEQVRDLNGQEDDGTLEVVALINQLKALELAAEKSVAAELETLIEGGECPLRDTVGRERILEMCRQIRKSCRRLDTSTTNPSGLTLEQGEYVQTLAYMYMESLRVKGLHEAGRQR